MRTSRILAACAIPFLLAGCNGNVLGGAAAACDSEEANRAVENLFKDELEFALQSGMAKTKQMGSYDATELEDSVQGIELNFADVRTSRDDPDSTRLSCKATMGIDLPDHVEKTANEVRLMAESVSVRDVANSHRLKRRNNMYSGDFDYFIQPTDDGEKLFAEIDDDSAPLQFLSEVITSYLLADEVRQAKVEEDLALAEEKRREREAKDAYEAEGQAALETAKA